MCTVVFQRHALNNKQEMMPKLSRKKIQKLCRKDLLKERKAKQPE